MSRAPGKARLRLDHIAIAVKDLERARKDLAKLFGVEPSAVEEVAEEAVRVSFFELGGARVELLEPTSPSSAVQRFLERGRSGVHHLALRVEGEDIAALHEGLRALGVPLTGDRPGPGSGGSRVFFVRPEAAAGVLVEFTQCPGEGGGKEKEA